MNIIEYHLWRAVRNRVIEAVGYSLTTNESADAEEYTVAVLLKKDTRSNMKHWDLK